MNLRGACLVVALLVAGCAAPSEGEDVRIADIHGLALDPSVPARLYIATHHGLFVAENDTRWSAVTEEPFDMMGFTMHPLDGSIMYASGHPATTGHGWAVGVVKSIDGGRTWRTLALKNEVDFHAMAMEAGRHASPDTIYGHHGGKVHFSSDGGATWTSRAVPFNVFALSVSSDGSLLAATDQGLQRIPRHLGGEWTALASQRSLAVATTGRHILLYTVADGLVRSIDSGATWSTMNWTAPAEDFPWGIAATETGSTVYVGTARGTIAKTADAGATWTRVR